MLRVHSSVLLTALIWSILVYGQGSQQSIPNDSSSALLARRGINLTEKGNCGEALPLLRTGTAHLADKQLKYP